MHACVKEAGVEMNMNEWISTEERKREKELKIKLNIL